MVRERRGKKSKSKDVEEPALPQETLAVPEEPKINRYLKREKSPFEVGDKKELQVASSHAIIDKACVMDISGGAAVVAGKVDEYINLLFTDYCSLDKASCADISEVKIVIVEEDETEATVIVPEVSIEEQEAQRKAEEERLAKEAEEARIKAEREEAERIAREEAERIAREEAEKAAAEEAERVRIEEEEKARIAAEEEKARKKAEAEAKKKAEEEEKARKEAEEKARIEAEAEAARKQAEEAAYDSDKELIPPKADDPTISWEAVEEEEPAIPPVLQELLEERAAGEETETESEAEMTEKDRDLEWQRQRQMMRPPLVISHLKSRAVATNTTAKLTCNVTGPSIMVRWLKNGNPIEIKPEKYKFFNSEGLLSLEILNVSKRDTAEYTCFVKNKNGETSTIANLTVYDNVGDRPVPPTFITIKESYNLHHDLLTLECRVRGTPKPHIQWMKDGDYIIPGDKYEQYELPDGTCKLVIAKPDPEEDSGTYTCEAECNGCSDSISHNVQYEGSVENQFNRIHRYYHRDPLKPFFKTGLTDYTIPSGGSIALFIETAPNCEAEWFRERWVIDHKPPKRYIFNDGNGFFACVINHATMDESGKYMCKVTNPYGTSQSSSYVDIINPNSVGKGQKPPIFLTRPQTEIKIRAGDPFSMSFRVQGEPKPRIQWFKGAREITNAGRTIKEVFNDYVRFSVKESKENDSGIYFLVARNKHGVDRAFCQVTVKQARTKGKDDKKVVENVVETAVDRSEKDRN